MRERLRSFDSKITFFAFADIITAVSGMLIFITLLLATDLGRPTDAGPQAANLRLQQELDAALSHQAEVDANNSNLQQLLSAAETAPASEKLETDIARLQAQLAEEKRKHAAVVEQLGASQSAVEARDRTLGLTGLKAQIQQVIEQAESLARLETQVRQEMQALDQRVAGVQSRLLKLRQWEGKLWLVPDRASTTKEPILAVVSGAGVKVQRFDHPEQTKEFAGASARTEFGFYLGEAKPLDQYFVFLVKPSGIALFERLVKSTREKGFEVGFDAVEEDKNVYFSTPQIPDDTTPPPPHPVGQGPPGGGGYSDPRGTSTGPGTSGGAWGGSSSGAPSNSGDSSGTSAPDGSPGGSGHGNGKGSGSGSFNGSSRGDGSPAGDGKSAEPGFGMGTNSAAGSDASFPGGNAAASSPGNAGGTGTGMGPGSRAGDSTGGGVASGETNASPARTSPKADGNERKEGTNSSASKDSRTATARPTPLPAAKTMSWWRRLLAWIASWF